MRLTRNPEIIRLIIILLVIFVLSLLFVVIGIQYSLHNYTEPLLNQQAALIGTVVEHYPDAEESLIRQFSSIDDETVKRGEAILSRYGYDDGQLIMLTDLMQTQRRLQIWLYVSIVLFVFGVVTTVFFIFIQRRYQTVSGLHDYLRNIAEGQTFLDIRDNGEGDFSILKNEIYKITTMLREQTESLGRDKLRLSESIADISHQLKTPLTSLSVMTDLLVEDQHPQMRMQFLERIRAQLDRLEWLVSSLLKLAKFDAGTVKMKQQDFPVLQLVQRAVDVLSIPVEIKELQVTVSGDPDVSLTGDFEWSAEALINVLKNCIEHTPEHGEIRIHWESNPIYTRISIADSGPGIDARDLPYIFNRFYRGQNASEDSVGIGLAMAQAIVKAQNGDITVKSEPGVGTTFMMTYFKKHI